jgi:hypothetical protein
LEKVPDERLVEDQKEGRGDEDEDGESTGDGPDAEDLPERLLHGRPVRIISSIESAGGRQEGVKPAAGSGVFGATVRSAKE